MAFKEKFTDAEWNSLKKTLFWVFEAVAGADNKIDKKETKALQNLVDNSNKFFNDLARELFMELKKEFDEFKSEYDSQHADYLEGMKQISSILQGKISDETALNFKKILVAFGVYIGHSSGSIFGSKLSDEEIKQVQLIGDLLGLSANDLQKPPDLQQIIQNISGN